LFKPSDAVDNSESFISTIFFWESEYFSYSENWNRISNSGSDSDGFDSSGYGTVSSSFSSSIAWNSSKELKLSETEELVFHESGKTVFNISEKFAEDIDSNFAVVSDKLSLENSSINESLNSDSLNSDATLPQSQILQSTDRNIFETVESNVGFAYLTTRAFSISSERTFSQSLTLSLSSPRNVTMHYVKVPTPTRSKTNNLGSVTDTSSISYDVQNLESYSKVHSKTNEVAEKEEAATESMLIWMISLVALMVLAAVLYGFLMMKEIPVQKEKKKTNGGVNKQ
jgi:lipopolysaccharide export LptBFGC system permease protein LptF